MTDLWEYSVVSKDVAELIGVISVEWQEIQLTIDLCVHMSPIIGGKETGFLCHELNNAQKIGFIKHVFPDNFDYSDIEKEAIFEFIKRAQICAENRNTLLHATVEPPWSPGSGQFATFHKSASGKHLRNTYQVPKDDLRQLALDMVLTRKYGRELTEEIFFNGMRPEIKGEKKPPATDASLPKKPAPPRKLDQHLVTASE